MPHTLTAAENGYSYKVTNSVVVQTCCTCFMLFGVDADFDKRRRNDHEWFYCPNGHPQHYTGETEEAKLKKRLQRAEERNIWQRDQWQAAEAEAKHLRRVAGAAKGRVTKMKNRIAAGVCPAPGCKRSGLGGDVVAHLKSCHPDFVIDD